MTGGGFARRLFPQCSAEIAMGERETWYVLEDGAAVHPSEVTADESGRLVHASGVAVALRGDAHSSRSVDPDAERAKSKTRDMKAGESKKPYKTRESKSD
jgi:hypothetical protein